MATFYKPYSGGAEDGVGTQAEALRKQIESRVGQLTASASKRDIPGNLVPDLYSGRISLEDFESKVLGSPDYNPTLGPQINYGQGPQNLTPAQQQALAGGQSISQVAEMVKPAILSSANAREQAVTDKNIIQSGISSIIPPQTQGVQAPVTGKSYTVQSGDTLSKIAQQMGTTIDQLTGYKSGDPNKIFPGEVITVKGGVGAGPISISTTNEAMKKLVSDLNTYISNSGQTLSPEDQAVLNKINGLESSKIQTLAMGEDALKNNNLKDANVAATAVQDYEKQIQKELTDFQAKVAPLREAYLKTLLPSAQVTDVNTRLKNLRASAQQSILDAKGQPISMPFIAGQTAQMKEQFALDESNLLAELGLAQEAQTAIQKATAGELDFAMQDYELATKVTDKLKANEDSLIERARQESSDAQTFYGNVAKNFGDFDITKNPEAVKELQRMAIDAGANPSLALEFAKGAWAESVADRAFKQQQESRLSSTTGASKPATGAQAKALSFYNRALGANTDASAYESKYANESILSQTQGKFAPSFAQSSEQQLYRQAQRAFTEARLRKDSGAAVPESEYAMDAQTYFAQPNDSADVIAQKARGRQIILDSLKYESGRAYEDYYGQPNTSQANLVQPLGVQTRIYNGATYEQDSNGDWILVEQ